MTDDQRGALQHHEYREQKRFPALDGLRAIAISIVILEHSHNETIRHASGGFVGVMLFFCLSGFLITSLLLREEAKYGSVQLRAFAVRRAFRILPLFYAVLGVYVVLLLVLKIDDARDFGSVVPYYAGFFQEHVRFAPHPPSIPYYPFEVSWSLGIEEKFYVVWPALAFGILSQARARGRMPVAILLALITVTAPLWFGGSGVYLFFYANILCGCIVALLLHNPKTYERVAWFGTKRGLHVAVGIALATFAATYLYRVGSITTVPIAMTFVGFSVLIAGLVTSPPRPLQRALDHPWVVRIGSASYATYLIHLLFLNAAEKVWDPEHLTGGLISITVTYISATVAAIIVNEIFEKPITEYGRTLAARWFPRPASTEAAPARA